jgi:hypothetical protein
LVVRSTVVGSKGVLFVWATTTAARSATTTADFANMVIEGGAAELGEGFAIDDGSLGERSREDEDGIDDGDAGGVCDGRELAKTLVEGQGRSRKTTTGFRKARR